MKAATGFAGLTLLLFSMSGFADGNPLIGTWKLKSYVMTTTTAERSTPFGEHPSGYLSYSPDGRMHAIGTADGRIMPHDIAATDEERAKLHRTMFAYAGTYSVEPGKVIHHVDISWNQVWNGTDQVRFYKLIGDTLTITTARGRSSYDGRESQSVLVWQKVAATP
jgi:Lipocalin-like domain